MSTMAYSPKRAARFYVPLLLQAFSQSLTYPLVGAIISHGPDGVDALTAFSLGQVIQFMIGALAGGLVMTGMVFAKTREGYRAFRTLNARMMAVLNAAFSEEEYLSALAIAGVISSVKKKKSFVEVYPQEGISCYNRNYFMNFKFLEEDDERVYFTSEKRL